MDQPDLQSKPVLAPRVRLQIDPVTGEPVLLYPEGILVLNPTAHAIVERCDGARTVGQLVAGFQEEYEADEETLRRDLLDTLGDLRQRQLIVFAP